MAASLGRHAAGGPSLQPPPQPRLRQWAPTRGVTVLPRAASSDPLLLRVARGEDAERTPVWLMRQAGRYMADFRKYSDTISFRQRSETPDIAIELSLQPWRAFHTDGVIMFSDILTLLPALGVEFDMVKGKGPVIANALRSAADLAVLRPLDDPDRSLPFIREILGALRREVEGRSTLLGFVGSPWTLAAYAVEGMADKNLVHTKRMMFHEPQLLHRLLDHLEEALVVYICHQIDCGAQVVQIFDSWAHHLSPAQFEEFSLTYAERVILRVHNLRPGTPLIFHANGGAGKLDRISKACSADVIGVDWTIDMGDARAAFGPDAVLQGNVDPMVLFGPEQAIRGAAMECLRQAGGRRHILNVGHGVVQGTPEVAVALFCEVARESSMQKSNARTPLPRLRLTAGSRRPAAAAAAAAMKEAAEPRASARLWLLCRAEAMAALHHPFVVALLAQTLPRPAFRCYASQDVHFLRAFARAMELAESSSPDEAAGAVLRECRAGILKELDGQLACATEVGGEDGARAPSAAAMAYMSFLLTVAEEGREPGSVAHVPTDRSLRCLHIVTAMTPCMRLYAFLGQELQRAAPFVVAPTDVHSYASWIATYASADFQADAMRLEGLLDRLAKGLPTSDIEVLEYLYRRAMQLELDFFSAELPGTLQPDSRSESLVARQLRERRCIFACDFDFTCSEEDSSPVLAKLGIDAVSGPASVARKEQWDAVAAQYVEEYEQLLDRALQPQACQDAKDASDGLRSFLEELSTFEVLANRRIESARILSNISLDSIKARGLEVTLKPNCTVLVKKLLDMGVEVHIVSVCWSRSFIAGALSGALSEGTTVFPSIHANELVFTSDGQSTGSLDWYLQSPLDKERLMMNTLTCKASKAEEQIMQPEVAGHVRPWSVFVGDSTTDLLALLHADVGIVLGDNATLSRVLSRFGIRLYPLLLAFVESKVNDLECHAFEVFVPSFGIVERLARKSQLSAAFAIAVALLAGLAPFLPMRLGGGALRLLMVVKRSAYAMYVEHHNDSRLRALLAAEHQSVHNMLDKHRQHEATIVACQRLFTRMGLQWTAVQRDQLHGPIDDSVDLVVTIGGDGTLLEASHHICHWLPVLGVNSDPTSPTEVEEMMNKFDARRSTGHLCAASKANMEQVRPQRLLFLSKSEADQHLVHGVTEDLLCLLAACGKGRLDFCDDIAYGLKQVMVDIIGGRREPMAVARMQTVIEGQGACPPALNDVLLAHPNPAAVSRFSMRIHEEGGGQAMSPLVHSRSSGLRLCTAVGSTAAMHSAGGDIMQPSSQDLQYKVREPIAPPAAHIGRLHGLLAPKEELRVSWGCRQGKLYVDGSHCCSEVRLGASINFSAAAPPLLVYAPSSWATSID
eukprot:SM000223S07305  [mRNA]  locus=s223:59029:71140:- [translate_table: standard]